MQTYHQIDERFIARFTSDHAALRDELADIIVREGATDETKKLIAFVEKCGTALSRHRYRVVEWRRRLDDLALTYRTHAGIASVIARLITLLRDVLTETKRQN